MVSSENPEKVELADEYISARIDDGVVLVVGRYDFIVAQGSVGRESHTALGTIAGSFTFSAVNFAGLFVELGVVYLEGSIGIGSISGLLAIAMFPRHVLVSDLFEPGASVP